MVSLSRWADEIDDDDFIDDQPVAKENLIPGKQDFLRPKEGERIVTEVKTDPESGKRYQIHRTFRLEKKLLSKGVIDRKTRWSKFGASKRDAPGPNSATTVVADEVLMQFLNAKNADESGMDDANNPFAKLQQEGKGFVKCRYCHDNHFSAKCPYKDVAGLSEISSVVNRNAQMGDDDIKKVDSDAKPGVFLPPALRGGNRRGELMSSGNQRKDEATIRVSNLPESMSETDMQELCSPFGKIDRIFLAKDRSTGVCKGFAFVTYQNRETAARALRSLNGYGYDHLILNVEWSKPANN
ncbi:unnamed protein product [Orchesella dallaii]|uniref:Eukaryotic translation initiation factor 3 subunit G n=1 Tax=Orchesella dallaii TaxID=48710 RepID=A0ABP1PNS3_9HEXA